MTAAPPVWAVWTDVLWCFGLGLILAALRDGAGQLLGKSLFIEGILDFLSMAGAAVVACGFAAGLSAGGMVRWYMLAAMLAGAAGWYASVSRALRMAVAGVIRLFAAPFQFARQRFTMPLWRKLQTLKTRHKSKRTTTKRQKKPKKRKNALQKAGRILYN